MSTLTKAERRKRNDEIRAAGGVVRRGRPPKTAEAVESAALISALARHTQLTEGMTKSEKLRIEKEARRAENKRKWAESRAQRDEERKQKEVAATKERALAAISVFRENVPDEKYERLLDMTPRELAVELLRCVDEVRFLSAEAVHPDFKSTLASIAAISGVIDRHKAFQNTPPAMKWLTAGDDVPDAEILTEGEEIFPELAAGHTEADADSSAPQAAGDQTEAANSCAAPERMVSEENSDQGVLAARHETKPVPSSAPAVVLSDVGGAPGPTPGELLDRIREDLPKMSRDMRLATIEQLCLCPVCYGWPLVNGGIVGGVAVMDCPACGRKAVRHA